MKLLCTTVLPALLMVGFAGCLHHAPDSTKPDGHQSSSTSSSAPSSSMPTPSTPPLNSTVGQILFSSCLHGATTFLAGPKPLFPTEPLPGWGPHSTPLTGVSYLLLYCDRVSVGPYERGPVGIMQENHDDGEAPPACAKGHSGPGGILTHLWLSDPDIATYLRQTWGIPSDWADVHFTESTVATHTETTWLFGLPAQPASSYTVRYDTPVFPGGDQVDREFWHNPSGGTSYFDAHEVWSSPSDQLEPGNGTFRAPLLASAVGTLADAGNPWTNASADIKVFQYRDPQCKELL